MLSNLPLVLSLPDMAALIGLFVVWFACVWIIENPPARHPSVSVLMKTYRHDWMRTFVTRGTRIFDGTLIDSLRQGTAFFASASLIAIGGGVALIGNASTVERLAQDLPLDTVTVDLALKLLVPVAILSNALLKFIWAHRLFGYCSIMMAAVPNDPADPLAFRRAEQAAKINVTAARSFNRGLESINFALASAGWLLGPGGLALTTVAAALVTLRREFWSHSRLVILDKTD
ncbi:DUF599 domain-containing protein [Fuscovulum blasticum]|uniref:DUF599 domain-containing protein n=1 Tax=Fuscovulum blasticum TaxID=1075 RepID=UPI000D3ED4B8|nr:DUF599 domain-containing protein [Fuscovulum blasticum]AWD22641.1 hypothetical protein B6K69_13970 [Fuscovulum blasticum]